MSDCRGWAFGLLRLSRADFHAMPLGEFWEAMRVYRESEEASARHVGELVRGAALRLFNVQLRPKDQIRKPEDFWPMPWDEDKVAKAANSGESPSLGKLIKLLGK